MPRTSPRSPVLSFLVLALALPAGLAAAQQASPPPKLERIEPGSDVPTTTIPAKRGTEIKETRQNGQVTQAEVTTPGGSHYYLKPNNQPGSAPNGLSTNSGPQWKVGEFDLSGKRHATSAAGSNAPTTADAPPPPPLPATADTEKK